jgi:hypothetical protein
MSASGSTRAHAGVWEEATRTAHGIRRALAVLLLAPAVVSLCETQSVAPPSRAQARKIIVDLNREWGRARVEHDRATLDRMLAPEFFVQLRDRKLTRAEFLDEISSPSGGGKLTRFDVAVLTVEPDGDGWVAVIEEKLELVPSDGGATAYSLWITRDRWKRFGDRWMALSSEAIGHESWRNGEKPPLREW